MAQPPVSPERLPFATGFGEDFTPLFPMNQTWVYRDDMIREVQDIGLTKGMVITIEKSRDGYVHLTCENYGLHSRRLADNVPSENPIERREPITKKFNCPFSLIGARGMQNHWSVTVEYGQHNHKLPRTGHGHAYVGRLNAAQKNQVKWMSSAGTPPKPIMASLIMESPGLTTARKSLYNTKAKMRREEHGILTPIEYIFQKLDNEGYFCSTRSMPDGTLKDMFFSHPWSMQLLQRYPYTILMDATYKTNEYNYPLFQIVGFVPSWKTFTIAVCMVQHENEETFIWVLERLHHLLGNKVPEAMVTDNATALVNALGVVFPNVKHLLCWVHILRNCETKALSIYGDKDTAIDFSNYCQIVMRSHTLALFTVRRQAGHAAWAPMMHYFNGTWLIPHKEKIVQCYTDTCFHIGTHTTNRVEGSQCVLKKMLCSATKGLDGVIECVMLMLKDQLQEVRISLEKDRNTISIVVGGGWGFSN